ncbi:MAG: hypothetical protein KGJ62_09795 [Armatimonadetes bacterium]|nr:hypothetical protein [Armatimonadota bacterium]MDE2205761.1 hypothetical protein [Armatimonadota bacterium]
MKWLLVAAIAAIVAFPRAASAQTKLEIGTIPDISDSSPTFWAMSGYEIIHIGASAGRLTPIMRTETFDARTVEILSRTQAPRLTAKDVAVVHEGGRDLITVRGYFLGEVLPQDARSAGMSKSALAAKWAAAVARVLPRVAPLPSRFGI